MFGDVVLSWRPYKKNSYNLQGSFFFQYWNPREVILSNGKFISFSNFLKFMFCDARCLAIISSFH